MIEQSNSHETKRKFQWLVEQNKLCCGCRKHPARLNQRDCHTCHAASTKAYRERKKVEQDLAASIEQRVE